MTSNQSPPKIHFIESDLIGIAGVPKRAPPNRARWHAAGLLVVTYPEAAAVTGRQAVCLSACPSVWQWRKVVDRCATVARERAARRHPGLAGPVSTWHVYSYTRQICPYPRLGGCVHQLCEPTQTRETTGDVPSSSNALKCPPRHAKGRRQITFMFAE